MILSTFNRPKILLIFIVFQLIMFSSCEPNQLEKQTYQHPIDYQPLQYICYSTDAPLQIDGRLDETAWQKAKPSEDFQDIQGDLKALPPFKTNVKMLWDSSYFYFGAFMEEPHIWAKLRQRDTVIFYDNDFEIFIDPDGDTHHYYEFEMNAFNTIWDLLLLMPYREKENPKVLNSFDTRGIKTGVHIEGTLNNAEDLDSFWTVEVAIPWEVLKEITPSDFMPAEGVQWRVNFSRVNWHMDTSTGKYTKQVDENGKNLPEENWVWSPQGYIAMHAPETWGYVQFSENMVGTNEVEFIHSEDEQVKWALRQIYYQQESHLESYGFYTKDLESLTIPNPNIENYEFSPQLISNYKGYHLLAKTVDGLGEWIMDENGRILLNKNTPNE